MHWEGAIPMGKLQVTGSLCIFDCLPHGVLGKEHHHPGVKPEPRGQRDSILKPFISHVHHFT